MSEPGQSVRFSDRVQGLLDGCLQRFAGARPNPAQHGLQLRPALLNRRQVRRIRGQVKQLGSAPFNGWAHPSDFVRTQVVHHHNVAGVQRRAEHLLDEGQEDLPVSGSVEPSSAPSGRSRPTPPAA
jgi:hypothetical protein